MFSSFREGREKRISAAGTRLLTRQEHPSPRLSCNAVVVHRATIARLQPRMACELGLSDSRSPRTSPLRPPNQTKPGISRSRLKLFPPRATVFGRHPEGLHVFAMLCRGVSAAKRASSAAVASSRCMASAAGLRQTLVHDEHVEAGATMVSVIEWHVCVCVCVQSLLWRGSRAVACASTVAMTLPCVRVYYTSATLHALLTVQPQRSNSCAFFSLSPNSIHCCQNQITRALHNTSVALPPLLLISLGPSLSLSSYTPTH